MALNIKRSEINLQADRLRDQLKKLATTSGISESEASRLTEDIFSYQPDKVVSAFNCLKQYGQANPSIQRLQVSAIEMLSTLDQGFVLFDTKGLPAKKCRSQSEINCWKDTKDGAVYTTGLSFDLNASCVAHHGDPGWELYPSPQPNILKAIAKATSAITNCYRSINSKRADEMIKIFSSQRPTIICRNSDLNDNNTSCAAAKRQLNAIELTHPNRPQCDDLNMTLFHEALHLYGNADNQSVDDHNLKTTHRRDAVYACEALCFPSSSNEIGYEGCLACVDSQNTSRCDRFKTK